MQDNIYIGLAKEGIYINSDQRCLIKKEIGHIVITICGETVCNKVGFSTHQWSRIVGGTSYPIYIAFNEKTQIYSFLAAFFCFSASFAAISALCS